MFNAIVAFLRAQGCSAFHITTFENRILYRTPNGCSGKVIFEPGAYREWLDGELIAVHETFEDFQHEWLVGVEATG